MGGLLRDFPDGDLCALALAGDREAEETLILRYRRLVLRAARPLFLAGGDGEDLIQEGMLGLLTAIREFDSGRDASFSTFAEVCVRNRLNSAVRAAARGKHAPLNSSVSLESKDMGKLAEPMGLEEKFIAQEQATEGLSRLRGSLSHFETAVLELYLTGLSYEEIARRLRRPAKSVDNAVQRIRRKLERPKSGDFSAS